MVFEGEIPAYSFNALKTNRRSNGKTRYIFAFEKDRGFALQLRDTNEFDITQEIIWPYPSGLPEVNCSMQWLKNKETFITLTSEGFGIFQVNKRIKHLKTVLCKIPSFALFENFADKFAIATKSKINIWRKTHLESICELDNKFVIRSFAITGNDTEFLVSNGKEARIYSTTMMGKEAVMLKALNFS